MRLPQFTVRSLLIGVALTAAVLAATVELERAPLLAITVYIFVPAIVIGLWRRLGFAGILLEVVPGGFVVLLVWAILFLPAREGLGLLMLFVGILAAVFFWWTRGSSSQASRLRALSTAAPWAIVSMHCSLLLAAFCIVIAAMFSYSRLAGPK